MTDQSLFEQSGETPSPEAAGETPQGQSVDQPQSNPWEDKLKSITTEDGRQKYTSVDAALDALPHAQKHISTLETELEKMRREMQEKQEALEKAAKLDDVLERLQTSKSTESPSVSGLDEQKVLELMDSRLQQKEAEAVAQSNKQQVREALLAQFGDKDKADQAYKAKAEEYGVSVGFLTELAAKSPKAVLAYFGVKESKAPSKINQGSLNTSTLNEQQPPQKGRNPMLVGTSTKDLLAEWNRIGSKYND